MHAIMTSKREQDVRNFFKCIHSDGLNAKRCLTSIAVQCTRWDFFFS